MTAADKPAFVALLAQLGTAFTREVTAPLIDLYWAALADCDLPALRRAATAHTLAERDRFGFPSVATLRALAGGGAVTHRAAAVTVLDALLTRCPAAKRWDTGYRGPTHWLPSDVAEEFGEAAALAFQSAGGQLAFRDPDPKSLPFLRRDFLAAYAEAEDVAHAGLLPVQAPAPRRLANVEAR